MQHDILNILLGLDLRSNFEVDFPRLSQETPSVRPLRMWFDACLCLQNHTQMHPSDSFSLDSRNTTLPCGGMPDSMFIPPPSLYASVFQAWRTARSPLAGHATEITSFEAYEMWRALGKIWNSPNTHVVLFS